MELILTPQALLGAGVIFVLRVTDMTCDTLRLLFVVRGRKSFAWVLGFIQSAVFIAAIGSVLSNLNNILNVIGYAAGFATGNVLGMLIEERLAIGHTYMKIISSGRGAAIAGKLRAAGYAVTEIPARGKDGMVTLLDCSVFRKDVSKVESIVLESDPEAFLTTEDVRPLRHGFWRA